MPSLSIVVPARNEEKYIDLVVEKILALSLPFKYEVVFIEGHSTDGTLDEIKKVAENYGNKINIQYASQNGKGKADAVWKGFDMAKNEVLVILDADLTVAPEDLPKFYNAAVISPDIMVNGTRMTLPMEKGAMRFFNKLGNIFFAAFLSIVVKRKLTDTLCGTKVLYKNHFEKIKKAGLVEKLDDPFCDFTLLLGASYLGLRIVEVSVKYRKRIYGSTKIRRFKDGWKLLKIATKYLFLPKNAVDKV